MKTVTLKGARPSLAAYGCLLAYLLLTVPLRGQTLLNVDFGVGNKSPKSGFAATGQATNDYWNLYRHYDPKYLPGMPFVTNGVLTDLKWADGSPTAVTIAVTNAPGVWGNFTGDSMYDSYIFAQNGSNMVVSVSGLPPGRYHFYLYGHADPDVIGEQNSVFTVRSGTNSFGPLTTAGSAGWRATSPWLERYQYVVFRDVPVFTDTPVEIEVAPGALGGAVLNGLQIISRGTSPSALMSAAVPMAAQQFTNLLFHEIRYEGKLTEDEARFGVTLTVESKTTNEISGLLFLGDLAVLAPEIPEHVRLASVDRQFRLFASAPGVYHLKANLVAKIQRGEQ
jgi:hypothetical protein